MAAYRSWLLMGEAAVASTSKWELVIYKILLNNWQNEINMKWSPSVYVALHPQQFSSIFYVSWRPTFSFSQKIKVIYVLWKYNMKHTVFIILRHTEWLKKHDPCSATILIVIYKYLIFNYESTTLNDLPTDISTSDECDGC